MNNTAINTNINPSENIHALQTASAGRKGSGIKRKDSGKTRGPEDSAVKIEIESHGGVSSGSYTYATDEKPREEDVSENTITAADVHDFADAYNRLPGILGWDDIAERVRREVYKPVYVDNGKRQISLYETGVAHSPNNHAEGELSVDDGTLNAVLRTRRGDVHALFLQEQEGLLGRLCALVTDVPDAGFFLRVCAGITNAYSRRE